jgi:Family of unknown function (DUF6152)
MTHKHVLAIVGAIALGTTIRVAAHHSFAAEFDAEQPVTLVGPVTQLEWTNPHIWMFIDVKGKDGTVVNWAIEGAAPNAMIRNGILKTTVPIGTIVTVEGFRAKSGKPVANGRNVEWPGGKKLFMGSSGTGAPKDPK